MQLQVKIGWRRRGLAVRNEAARARASQHADTASLATVKAFGREQIHFAQQEHEKQCAILLDKV